MGYNSIISALSPDFWWKINEDGDDSADSLDPDYEVTPSTWPDSIVPAVSSTQKCGLFQGPHYYRYPNSAIINSGVTTQKTIAAWFTSLSLTTGDGKPIFAAGGGTASHMLYQYSDKIYFCASSSSGSDIDYVVTGSIVINTSYFVVATMNATAGSMRIYLNGENADEITGGLNIGSGLATHSGVQPRIASCVAARNHLGDSVSDEWDGRLADIVYWGEQTPLTLTQIQSIYNAGMAGGVPSLMFGGGL